jgi:alkanesulfonate monooxygenase SsuD/methylene tetrahydromethanopterin reductase-like flavin-dependent oxidoreductase (luciferase family)
MLKIGVLLPCRFADTGDYLADARALDCAGVDSLWLGDGGYEPWLVLAALATVTGQSRLVAPLTVADGAAAAGLDLRMATLAQLSRGRTVLSIGQAVKADGVEALIALARRFGSRVILDVASERHASLAARLADGLVGFDDSPELLQTTLPAILRLREEAKLPEPFESWSRIKVPDDREQWQRTLREYEAAGAYGIIVPADPKLLDLLRNVDGDDDRSDLQLAQG